MGIHLLFFTSTHVLFLILAFHLHVFLFSFALFLFIFRFFLFVLAALFFLLLLGSNLLFLVFGSYVVFSFFVLGVIFLASIVPHFLVYSTRAEIIDTANFALRIVVSFLTRLVALIFLLSYLLCLTLHLLLAHIDCIFLFFDTSLTFALLLLCQILEIFVVLDVFGDIFSAFSFTKASTRLKLVIFALLRIIRLLWRLTEALRADLDERLREAVK